MKIRNIISTLRLLRKINVTRKDIVLEIGSGANPFIRSDVLLDKFPHFTGDHRPGKTLIKKDERPFIAGDAHYLPFADKSFDLVIARHLLEHLDAPEEFMSEVKRVGKRIFLTTPSPFIEILHGAYKQKSENTIYNLLEHGGKGTPGHKWFVSAIKNSIVMTPKAPPLYPLYLILGKHIKHNTRYSKNTFLKTHPDWLETVFICNSDEAEIHILGDVDNEIGEVSDPHGLTSYLECIQRDTSIKSKIKSFVRTSFLSTKNKLSIYDIPVCPVCKEQLLKANDELICSKCGTYPIVNDIPVMMAMS